MNNPNPLLPQGSLHSQSKGKSNFRIAVFTILAIHVVLICGFLIQGCKREPVQPGETTAVEPNNQLPDTFDPFTGTDAVTNPFPDDANSFPPYNDTASGTISTGAPTVIGASPTGGVSTAAPGTTYRPSIPTSDPLPVATPTPAGETTTHVVVSGETYSTIAPKYKVSVRAIEDANPGVNPSRLQIGQKLNIPAPSVSAATATTSGSATTGDFIIYTVKSGDVLGTIANKHNVTVSAIKSANGLKTDRINVGQKGNRWSG